MSSSPIGDVSNDQAALLAGAGSTFAGAAGAAELEVWAAPASGAGLAGSGTPAGVLCFGVVDSGGGVCLSHQISSAVPLRVRYAAYGFTTITRVSFLSIT